ncbi:hypothetical protein GOODEAATRI_030126 [Goodea atripinnis]|uniref:Uncharacterized protein n=1 Tax=Goodea atripinnis TaxID=208336 RepID=A0ABV0MWD4_9TELE
MSNQVRLRLLPGARCLFDEPVQVKVAGLRPKQVVTMRATSTDEKGVVFSSTATYRANNSGDIDLIRDASLSGSYVGVEPMGLLWSMRPNVLHKRFQKTNSLNPYVVKFSVHEDEGKMLAEATNQRYLMGDGVSRVPVKEGNIRGVLFTPPGLSEKRAALLASRGFMALTVALYGYDDLPKSIEEVGSRGVGVLSISKSGDLALSVASYLAGVQAVVSINGCSANAAFPLHYKKRQLLPALKFDINKLIATESGAIITKYAMHDPLTEENKATLVPIERAGGHFLFIASEDDLNWDSKAYMDGMVDRLKRHGKENFESVSYPRAGHYLEPPYGPYCPSSFHGIVGRPVLWGGEPRTHAAAEVHLWRKIQQFFRTHLTCDRTQTKSRL